MPIILARDISEETAVYIFENSHSLKGIDVGEDWNRVYTGGEAFSHILGYTGKISAEDMERYSGSSRNYTIDSVVGKAGIIADNLINTKKFDKVNISDTTDIRIPIYDVYLALVDNDIIRLENLWSSEATELEKYVAATLEIKQKEEILALITELSEGTAEYGHLSEEMQENISYAIDEIGILNRDVIDNEDDIYRKWINKNGISGKEFLIHAVECGWINAGFIESEQKYFTADEMYALLIEAIKRKLAYDSEFEKLIFKQLILEEKISGKDLCRLLYDQEVLANADEDYEKLVSGKMDVFSFLKKKIEQLKITPAQLALDPCSASAAVVQPESGKVLALVSYPGYDNNRLANQMDSAYYNRLLRDRSLPLYNRATQQLTAPGSTFKPVTIIAGIQEGVISANTSIFCDGVFDAVVPNLKCWKHSGHGNVVNASTALQFSCNDYMCEIAYRIGLKNGIEYTDKKH